MKNSTFSQEMLKVDPTRYIECFICEQNMLGVGIGVACRDRTVAFASTFAAFLTRGFDNLRMGVISQTNLNVVGRSGIQPRSRRDLRQLSINAKKSVETQKSAVTRFVITKRATTRKAVGLASS